MSDALNNHRTNLQRRMMGSAVIFVIFMIVASIAGVRGTTYQDDTMMVLSVLIIAAFTILPRSTAPRAWPTAATPEGEDQLEMMRDSLKGLENRATYQRFFYFAIALLLVVALPLMGI